MIKLVEIIITLIVSLVFTVIVMSIVNIIVSQIGLFPVSCGGVGLHAASLDCLQSRGTYGLISIILIIISFIGGYTVFRSWVGKIIK